MLFICFLCAFLVNMQSDSRGLFFGLLFFCFFFAFLFAFWFAFFLLFFKRPCDRDFRIAFLITFSALFFCFSLFPAKTGTHKS